MAGWTDLPNELTYDILHIFASDCAITSSNRDLLSAVLICRHFHAILESMVYASPQIPNSGETNSYHDVPYAPLRRFVRTMISRPDLALLVKEILVHCDHDAYGALEHTWRRDRLVDAIEGCCQQLDAYEADAYIASLPDAPKHDMPLLVSAAAQKGLPNGLLLNGGCPGLIILLLHHLPSLASFSAKVTLDIAIVGLAALGVLPGGIPAGLRSTTAVNLECVSWPGTGTIYVGYITPFWNLPSLTKFTCRGAYAHEIPPNWAFVGRGGGDEAELGQSARSLLDSTVTLRSRSSKITHVRLESTIIINAGVINLLLSTPRGLESFQYEPGIWADEVHYALADIYLGLRSQKDTLTELFITCDDWTLCDNRASRPGPLTIFTSLRHLKLPAAALIQFEGGAQRIVGRNPLDDLLPPSLVTIELDLGGDAFAGREAFLNATGLPYSLLSTSRFLPELRTFNLAGCIHQSGVSCCDLPLWSDVDAWSAGHEIAFAMTD